MKVIRLLVLSVLSLFLLITVISLFIPSHIRISKAIDIQATNEEVMLQLKDPSQWRHWFPGLDSGRLLYSGDSIKGVVVEGRQSHYIRLKEIRTDEVITVLTAGRKNITSGWKLSSYADPRTLTLQWYMDFHLSWYPWDKFTSFIFEKSYGPIMEAGLANLKKRLAGDRTSHIR